MLAQQYFVSGHFGIAFVVQMTCPRNFRKEALAGGAALATSGQDKARKTRHKCLYFNGFRWVSGQAAMSRNERFSNV